MEGRMKTGIKGIIEGQKVGSKTVMFQGGGS